MSECEQTEQSLAATQRLLDSYAADWRVERQQLQTQADKLFGEIVEKDNEIHGLYSAIVGLKEQLDARDRAIQSLHDRYAHEGGMPQVLSKYTLLTWLAALNIPRLVDSTATGIPNVFYVTFASKLTSSEERQIAALGLVLVHQEDQHLRGHYMLKWQTPRNDEA